MRNHRNPRKKLPKRQTTDKPRRKRGTTRRLDPRAADALRMLLEGLEAVDKGVAMRFVEALATFVTFAAKRRGKS
jgi:hypothetical protein